MTIFGPLRITVPGDHDGDDDEVVSPAYHETFYVSDPKLQYQLEVANHGAKRVSVKLNDKYIFKGYTFRDSREVLTQDVKLSLKNQILFRVIGDQGGYVTIKIVARNAALPSDPSTIAPPVAGGTSSANLADQVSFLYTGARPIQTGVAPNAILPARVAVLRGKLLATDGSPLAGVTVSVVGYPEFGQTMSRADGAYDLAVNGGQLVALSFKKDSYLEVQRKVNTPARDYKIVADTVMTAIDAHISTIRMGNGSFQMASGSRMVDQNGSRQARVLFPAGTTATLVFPNGGTRSASTLSIRATEFTVGNRGHDAVPAELPKGSAYAYAVELSADEAQESNASRVQFNQPVYHYIENFLKFPVGALVPTGFYDRTASVWIDSKDGRVISILRIQGGVAQLDVNGKGVAATAAELKALGVTTAEQRQLAAIYNEGQSLWRTPVPYLSVLNNNIEPSSLDVPWVADHPSENECHSANCSAIPGIEGTELGTITGKDFEYGSIIDPINQVLHESIPVGGTPYHLIYSSDRGPDHLSDYTISIPVTGPSIANVVQAKLEISVAGQYFTKTFAPAANLSYVYTWNGKDAYGRPVSGRVNAIITTTIVMAAGYSVPTSATASTTIPAREPFPGQRIYSVLMGSWDQKALGLGGWGLDVLHHYDLSSQSLYLGSGERLSARVGRQNLTVFAGNGSSAYSGDGGPAKNAGIPSPAGLAVSPDGSVYLSDAGRIRRVNPDGTIVPVSVSNSFSLISAMTLGFDGSLYVADSNLNTISKVAPTGLVTKLAGGGSLFIGDTPVAALSASINQPNQLVISPDGTLYFTSRDAGIFALKTNGTVYRVPDSIFYGSPALAISPTDGSLYLASTNIYRMTSDSGITAIVSGKSNTFTQIAIDSRGALVLYANNGNFFKLVGENLVLISIDSTPAEARSMRFLSDGSMIFAETDAHVVYRAQPVYPGYTQGSFTIASNDGSQLYDFDPNGNHIATRDSLTGAQLLIFNYLSNGALDSVVDSSGNITKVSRRTIGGLSYTLTSPFNVVTSASLFSNSVLQAVSLPDRSQYAFAYTGSNAGLLTKITYPTGGVSQMAYDSMGLLVSDQDAAGGVQTFERSQLSAKLDQQIGIAYSSATGLTKQRTMVNNDDGSKSIFRMLSSLAASETRLETNGGMTLKSSDGTVTTTQVAPDPRFGLQASYDSSSTTTIPSTSEQDSISQIVSKVRSVQYQNPSTPETSPFRLVENQVFNGRTTQVVFDSSTRTSTTTTPEGRVSYQVLDELARPIELGSRGFAPVQIGYDSFGRPSQIQQGMKKAILSYDSSGYLASLTDGLGQTTQYLNDAMGRVRQTILPDGRAIALSYDANGNLVSVTPPGKAATTQSFNLVNLITQFLPPMLAGSVSTPVNYFYDLDRRVTQISYPDGTNATFDYDPVTGKIARSTDSTNSTFSEYTYDSRTGYLTQMASDYADETPTQVTSFNYQGPLLSAVHSGGLVFGSAKISYNQDFNETAKTVTLEQAPNSTGASLNVHYTYDKDGLINGSDDLSLTRDSRSGLVTAIHYQSSAAGSTAPVIVESLTYDSYGALTSDTVTSNGQTYYATVIAHDALGRITQKNETVMGASTFWEYSYDATGRLIQVKKNGSVSSKYVYDSNGNRIQKVTASGTEFSTYDEQDRIATSGPRSYSFNASGQLTAISDSVTGITRRYFAKANGNYIRVTQNDGIITSLHYDGQGSEVAKIKRRTNGIVLQQDGYIYENPLRPLAKYTTDGKIAHVYQYVRSQLVPDAFYDFVTAKSYRVVTDERGSVRLLIDGSNGKVVQQMDYDEFGILTQDTNPGVQPFGFAGGFYNPEFQFVRFGARQYDPVVGRFISRDPIGFRGGSVNLYSYVLNDPINFVDPNGLESTAISDVYPADIRFMDFNVSLGSIIKGSGSLEFPAPVSSPASGNMKY